METPTCTYTRAHMHVMPHTRTYAHMPIAHVDRHQHAQNTIVKAPIAICEVLGDTEHTLHKWPIGAPEGR